jgi:hypothetical protein
LTDGLWQVGFWVGGPLLQPSHPLTKLPGIETVI